MSASFVYRHVLPWAAAVAVLSSVAWAQQTPPPPIKPPPGMLEPPAPTTPAPSPSLPTVTGTNAPVLDLTYHDRIIDPGSLAPLASSQDRSIAFDSRGLPRSSRVELSWGLSHQGPTRDQQTSVRWQGTHTTAQWGTFSWVAQGYRSQRSSSFVSFPGSSELPTQGFSGTLWQRGWHVGDHWTVTNGAGVLYSPVPSMLQHQYRFVLPSVPYLGVSSQWQGGVNVVGGFGRLGSYDGGSRVPGFVSQTGTMTTLGAERLGPQWSGSVAYLGLDGVHEAGQAQRSQAMYVGVGHHHAGQDWQLNVLTSQVDGRRALGWWWDGSWKGAGMTQRAGAYRLGDHLAWGKEGSFNNDVEGAYYRLARNSARWDISGGVDVLRSVSGQGLSGVYATTFARYQASSKRGYGGSMSVRDTGHLATSVELFLDQQTSWGLARFQVDQAHSDASSSWQVGWNQSYPTTTGSRLSTSLTASQTTQQAGGSTRRVGLAVYGGRDMTDTVSIDGSVEWNQAKGLEAAQGVDANVSVRWALRPAWNLVGTIYKSQGRRKDPFVLDPLAQDVLAATPRSDSVFVTLSHDWRAGQPLSVVGGDANSPHGKVAGVLYFDANRNGQRDANEDPMPQVTLVIDNMFSTVTDEQGRFVFPYVAAGAHTLEVVIDNVPLPWTFGDQARQHILVRNHDTTELDWGAVTPL